MQTRTSPAAPSVEAARRRSAPTVSPACRSVGRGVRGALGRRVLRLCPASTKPAGTAPGTQEVSADSPRSPRPQTGAWASCPISRSTWWPLTNGETGLTERWCPAQYRSSACALLWNPSTAAAKSLHSCPTLCDPIDGGPPGSSVPGILQGKNAGVGCHFLLQCRKVKRESEVAQSCPTLRDPMDCILPRKSTGVGCHCDSRYNNNFSTQVPSTCSVPGTMNFA